MQFDATIAGWLAVAALAGMAVGIEREWSGHTLGPRARFAGVRTFLLIGLLGGLAGWLIGGGYAAVAVTLLGAASLLVVAAYILVARQGGEAVDGTTEMAALVALMLGTVAGLGFPLVTSAAASIMVLVLAEKSRIHSAIRRIGERELDAALQFAVLALVVLPLLPAGPYGPFDSIRPRALWTVVLVFSALNFVGYGLRRAVGAQRGYILSGLAGGVVSSTAVTLQFARWSREDSASGQALALGVVGACTVLVVRVLTLTLLLAPSVAFALVPYLAPIFFIGAALLAGLWNRDVPPHPAPPEKIRNPLGLLSSLKMAVAFQVVLTLLAWIRSRVGDTAVLPSAAALGLTDVDALTYAMCRLGSSADFVAIATQGIAVGILSNTVLKATLAIVIGRGPFRAYATGGLFLLGLGCAMGFWVAR